MTKIGEEYEKAVFEFVKVLDPSARVIFNHFVPDRDTGELRQCDVWVNAKFGGLFPLSIYISCKDHNRKLTIGDIDAFDGEMRSRRANNGIIYSKSGFTKPALAKAKNLGISCCRLFENEPAEIPEMVFLDCYACYPSVTLEVLQKRLPTETKVWNDILDLHFGQASLIELINKEYSKGVEESVNQAKGNLLGPQKWEKIVEFSNGEDVFLKIQFYGWWKWYLARQEATLLDGTHCETSNSFKGTFTGPAIDTWSSNPGSDWTQIQERDTCNPKTSITAIMYEGKILDQLREKIGAMPI